MGKNVNVHLHPLMSLYQLYQCGIIKVFAVELVINMLSSLDVIIPAAEGFIAHGDETESCTVVGFASKGPVWPHDNPKEVKSLTLPENRNGIIPSFFLPSDSLWDYFSSSSSQAPVPLCPHVHAELCPCFRVAAAGAGPGPEPCTLL